MTHKRPGLALRQPVNKTEIVRQLLARHPEAIHDDKRFVAEFWRLEQPLIAKFASAETLLREFVRGEFTSPETILRLKRQVLKERSDLLTLKVGSESPAKD
jgi:hypothetical protein